MTKVWGPKLWYFFHIFSEQINDKFFIVKRNEILSLLSDICNNLPCPTCSEHARAYLKKYRFHRIETKEQLKLFFYNFHNSVNQRTKKEHFPYNQMELYKKGKILKILDFVYVELSKPVHNDNFTLSFFKKNAVKNLRAFISKYQTFFTTF